MCFLQAIYLKNYDKGTDQVCVSSRYIKLLDCAIPLACCCWVSLRAMAMIQTIWVFVQRLLDKWVFYNFWESSVVHDSYSCRCLFIHLNLRSKPLLRKKAPTSICALIWRQKTFQPKLVQDGFKITLCSYTYWEWARNYTVHCSILFASFQDGALTRSPPYAISNQTKNRHHAPFLFHIILFPRSAFVTKTK